MMKRMLKSYYLLSFLFLLGIAVSSCGPTQYKTYKKYVKRKNTAMGYHSNYQKKLKRNTQPVNRNYIIRNSRQSPSWR